MTENKGDIISREALRKAFHERIWYFDKSSWDEANALIDNALTVEPFAKVHYETFREYERPIGKWLNNRVAFHFTCDYCGCNIN